MEDRISELPEPILHHILSLLSKKEALRTCTLSKSWGHLASTRPLLVFDESSFRGSGSNKKFLSSVENTLQRYTNQKLSIQDFVLSMWGSDSKSVSLLHEWIPKIITHMGAKTFSLSAHNYSPPQVVFQAESLSELYLKYCKLDQIINNVKLHMLKRLDLHGVYIEEKTFNKIMSSCPLIEHLVLRVCHGLSNVKVSNARYLKHFDCNIFKESRKNDSILIQYAPSIETIRIENCTNWRLAPKYNFPSPLKSLFLCHVRLTGLPLFIPNSDFPCLEELEIRNCSGFSQMEISSSSIKRLIINVSDRPIDAANIDAPNIIYFELVSSTCLPTITFATTNSREWESRIKVCRSSDSNATWLRNLYEVLKALRQSQISLDISWFPLTYGDTRGDGGGNSCEPVVIENLCLTSSSELLALLDSLLRICRPRNIQPESVLKTLTRQRDLEKSSIQVSDNVGIAVLKTLTRQRDSDKNRNGERLPVRVLPMSNNVEIAVGFLPILFFILRCWFILLYLRTE